MEPASQLPGEDTLVEALAEPVPFEGPAPTIDELVARADAGALVQLGAGYRAGVGVERDLFKALECFEAASTLGAADAEYLVGVAFFNGLGIAADPATATTRLRSAAQRGSLRAKIYLANLYELGVHFARDAEKADVWYRNVARAAGVTDDPESIQYELAMAEHGCVRYALRLVADESLPKRDRAHYLKKAKLMGYEHRLRDAKRGSEVPPEPVPTPTPAPRAPDLEPPSASGEAPPAAAPATATDPRGKPPAAAPEEPPIELGSRWTFGGGALSFLVALFFAAAASGAAFLATEGSRTLFLHDRAIPLIGRAHELVTFGVLVTLGVLPAMAVYRPRVVAIAGVLGALGGVGAYFLHASSPLLWDAPAQAGAAGLAVYLLVALALGVLGGTRIGRA